MLGAVPTDRSPSCPATSPTLMGWADEIRTLKVRTNADTPHDAAPRASSAPRASASAAPSTCSSSRPHRRGARDDPGRRREGPPRGARQDPADAAPGFRRALRRSWRACRSRSACSIRRCTSSCRTPTRRSRRSPRRPASTSLRCASRARPAARVQPDARPSRLPPRHHLSRRSTRCRRARSSKPPSEVCKETGETVIPEIMIPLVGDQEGARHPEGRDRPGRRRGHDQQPAASSSIWSAR